MKYHNYYVRQMYKDGIPRVLKFYKKENALWYIEQCKKFEYIIKQELFDKKGDKIC